MSWDEYIKYRDTGKTYKANLVREIWDIWIEVGLTREQYEIIKKHERTMQIIMFACGFIMAIGIVGLILSG